MGISVEVRAIGTILAYVFIPCKQLIPFGLMATRYRQEGKRLQEARTALGLTQADLAERIGSSLAAVKGYERGVSAPNRKFSLALALAGINMEYVFLGVGEKLIPPELRAPHSNMLGSVMSESEGPGAYAERDADSNVGGLRVMEPMAKLRSSTQALADLCAGLGFTPPMQWVVLIQELMVIDGLSERGVRRILETLKAEERSP